MSELADEIDDRRRSIGARRNPETEQAILEAAETIMAEQGIAGFSIEAVAKRADREGKAPPPPAEEKSEPARIIAPRVHKLEESSPDMDLDAMFAAITVARRERRT